MNKTVIASVAMLAAAAVLSLGLYVHGNRFSAVGAGNGRVYRVDRRTGRTVLIVANQEVPVESRDSREKKPEFEFTAELLGHLTGRAGLSYGSHFSGSLYNGISNVTVTELTILVKTTVNRAPDSRYYSVKTSIPPESAGTFGMDIILGDTGASYDWSVARAKGRSTD